GKRCAAAKLLHPRHGGLVQSARRGLRSRRSPRLRRWTAFRKERACRRAHHVDSSIFSALELKLSVPAGEAWEKGSAEGPSDATSRGSRNAGLPRGSSPPARPSNLRRSATRGFGASPMKNDPQFQPFDASQKPRFADVATFLRARRIDIAPNVDIAL